MTDERLDAVVVGGGTTAWWPPPTWRGPAVGFGCWSVWTTSAAPRFGARVRRRRRPAVALLVPGQPVPRRIVDDLGARVRLMRRRFSSYTPSRDGGRTGLLSGRRSTFERLAPRRRAGFDDFYRRCRIVTSRLWPTLTEPIIRAEARRMRATSRCVAGPDRRPDRRAITEAVYSDLIRRDGD